MKFIVSRTSAKGGEKPCERAKRESVRMYDETPYPDIERWRSSGRKYKKTGNTFRVYDKKLTHVWTIQLALFEITKFLKENDEIIIRSFNSEDIPQEIEIHDVLKEFAEDRVKTIKQARKPRKGVSRYEYA